jgi:hypothetical protein
VACGTGLGAATAGGVGVAACCGDAFSGGVGTGPVIGLPPDPVGVGTALTAGGAPGVPVGLAAGGVPGVPAGFRPTRFGGMDLLPVAGAFGEPPGVALTTGACPPTLGVGFARLEGICFWPSTVAGEPIGLGDPTVCPF